MNNNFLYKNFPKNLKIDDYKNAIDSYVSLIRDEKDLVSVYQIGGVNAEGISDIDLIIVLRDDCEIKDGKRFFIDRLRNSSLRYLFHHNPFFCSESFFPNLAYIIYYENIKHLYGVELSLRSPTETERYFRDVLLIQENTVCLLASLKKLSFSIVIDLRELLQILFSFSYSVKLAERILEVKSTEWEKYNQSVQEARANWLSYSSKKDLLRQIDKLLFSAIEIGSEICESMGKFLGNFVSVSLPDSELIVNIAEHIRLVFYDSAISKSNEFTPHSILNKIFIPNFIRRKTEIILKDSFLVYFLLMSYQTQFMGPLYLASFFKSAENVKISFINMNYESIMKKRIKMLDSQIEFIINNNIKYGWFINYFYFRLR